ncbi:sensor histidine kinase [Flavobacterium sp. RHBU_3]|uniref:sensor histidine kinase n=1 Tax=Flavobacterium sp. RHBU_3 TaxID=3391184 RepID=UPI0039854E2A
MSLSLLGIIVVQLYWVDSSLKNSDEQFRYHIKQVLGRVAGQLENLEAEEFYKVYQKYADSVGTNPSRADMRMFYDSHHQRKTRNVVYSGQLTPPSFDDMLFDKAEVEAYVKRKTSKSVPHSREAVAEQAEADRYLNFQMETLLKDFREYYGLDSWLSSQRLKEVIARELDQSGVNTPFEFSIYYNGMPTRISSGGLSHEPQMNEHVLFENNNGYSKYRLFVSFPHKERYLLSSILGITLLSLVFTLVIIIAYLSAINQLITQKNISEIKTDFINNMTHEFKTPIATINLALDAIKNPKIFEDKDRVQYYLQMIREENKRMHSQVENVLQISRLDRKELDISKEATDVNEILENAIEHILLLIENRDGVLTRHFSALRTTALLNEVHFTNVIVNILDNAIKYSPDKPVIDIYTENVKDFILIKIQDQGMGMNKNTQKMIFEKFYREHTGDRHDVKGHGLGLAYVKRIIDDHNCHIYVESEKGKGSTFIIKMPLIN